MPNFLALQVRPSLMKIPLKKSVKTNTNLQNHEEIFEKHLHAYTITHAIDDRNVFDSISTISKAKSK